MITTDVENYPGFSEGIRSDLMVGVPQTGGTLGTEFLEEWITDADLSERPSDFKTDNYVIYAGTLIIARELRAKWLGIRVRAKVPARFRLATASRRVRPAMDPSRISQQGIGGGRRRRYGDGRSDFSDSICCEGLCGPPSRQIACFENYAGQAFQNPKIEFIWNTAVEEILGEPEAGVRAFYCAASQTNEGTRSSGAQGLYRHRHKPNTDTVQSPVDHGRKWLYKIRALHFDECSRSFLLWRRSGCTLSSAVTAAARAACQRSMPRGF